MERQRQNRRNSIRKARFSKKLAVSHRRPGSCVNPSRRFPALAVGKANLKLSTSCVYLRRFAFTSADNMFGLFDCLGRGRERTPIRKLSLPLRRNRRRRRMLSHHTDFQMIVRGLASAKPMETCRAGMRRAQRGQVAEAASRRPRGSKIIGVDFLPNPRTEEVWRIPPPT